MHSVGTVPASIRAKFEFRIFSRFGANPQKLMGSRDTDHAPFSEIFSGVMSVMTFVFTDYTKTSL